MDNSKVNGKLLECYYLGLCTPDECHAVEQWQTSSDEVIIEKHTAAEEQEIEAGLWDAIAASTIQKELSQSSYPFRHFFYKYGIAASLILFISIFSLSYFLLQKKGSETIISMNNMEGSYPIRKNINGLVLTALPKSNIRAALNKTNNGGDISFCEAVLVSNESLHDVNLQFENTCKLGGGTMQRHFVCKKGVTYLAVKLNEGSPEIIIVDQRYLEDMLPLNVAMKINREIRSMPI
jgi:hypothetical protein